MSSRRTRLTIAELRPIVAFYHLQFPAWRVVRDDTLVREAGPVLQAITFERLSDGTYRPVGHIRVLVAPEDTWVFELSQYLHVKVRQIESRAHLQLRDNVLQAIKTEFSPPVDQPLVADEVLRLYEERAVPTSPQAYSLAALTGYLGDTGRALSWCDRFEELLRNSGRPLQDYDHRRRVFVDQLRGWLRRGEAQQRLGEVLEAERRKLKLA